jgi:hypothetical protein
MLKNIDPLLTRGNAQLPYRSRRSGPPARVDKSSLHAVRRFEQGPFPSPNLEACMSSQEVE